MAEDTSFAGKAWEFAKARAKAIPGELMQGVAQEAERAVADVGSTFQACLYSGWHTQSAAVDSPEHIAEDAAKQQIQDKVAPEHEGPKVGLEKE